MNWSDNKQIHKHLPSTYYSKFPSINDCTSYGTMNLKIHFKPHCIYRAGDSQKTNCLQPCTHSVQPCLNRKANAASARGSNTWWGREGGWPASWSIEAPFIGQPDFCFLSLSLCLPAPVWESFSFSPGIMLRAWCWRCAQLRLQLPLHCIIPIWAPIGILSSKQPKSRSRQLLTPPSAYTADYTTDSVHSSH